MWKIIPAIRILGARGRKYASAASTIGRRTFLSEAFQCQEAWERRFEARVLQNVKFDEFYHELEQKNRRDGRLSEIDVDVFANAVRDEIYADELEDLIHKLRLCSNTTKTLPSTPHAVVRYFLENRKIDQLIRILDDRLNYGIIPDDHALCLILDKLIKDKNFTDAARISVTHMLQEDWNDPLLKCLALYACHMYSMNPCPWEVPVEEDDGEEIKVRVAYIRNPFFDDHFDLRDPLLLVGKTLAIIGVSIPDAIGRTYRLVGLGFYKKWEKVVSYLQELLSHPEKPVIYLTGVKLLEDVMKKEADDEKGTLPAEVKDSIHELLKELENKGLVTSDDLHAAIVDKVKQTVAAHENETIEGQKKVYQKWMQLRDEQFKRYIEELDRKRRLAVVQEEKEKLVRRERELFFFDKEDELDLLIEKNEALKGEEVKKPKTKLEKLKEEEAYVPPEVIKRRSE